MPYSPKIHQPFFYEAREFKVAIKLEQLFRFERRFGDTGERLSAGRLTWAVLCVDLHLN
jgi:hypothetical protein